MPKTHTLLFGTLIVGLVMASAHTGARAGQDPAVADVLRMAGEYHTAYVNKVSGVTLEEQYQLIDITGGKMSSAVRIASDVVLVNLNGGVAALRDPYEVDTKPLRERTPRITTLLAAPATPTLRDWETAISYPPQGAMHFVLDLILKVNEPTTALKFIAPALHGNFTYKLDGKRKINNVQTVGLGFDEPAGQEKKYLLGTRGNARAFGRIWVDPATGTVHETELWIESKTETATIKVKYAPNTALNLVLPSEMNDTYEEREAATGPRDFNNRSGSSGRSGARISFQASAKYSKPTYAAIDLRTLRR